MAYAIVVLSTTNRVVQILHQFISNYTYAQYLLGRYCMEDSGCQKTRNSYIRYNNGKQIVKILQLRPDKLVGVKGNNINIENWLRLYH